MKKHTEIMAKKIRRKILDMHYRAQSSHIGSSYSVVDILVVLYERVLKVSKDNLKDDNRDRFILSKGHAASALYAILAEKNFFPAHLLKEFSQDAGLLAGHVLHTVPGVEVSTGSLGHGLSIGCGIALAARLDKRKYNTYVIISDGECDEGSTWEAAMFAGANSLNNLIVIIDYNKIQSLGRVNEVLNLEPLSDKWAAFGWNVVEVNGHKHQEIFNVFASDSKHRSAPLLIIAHTVKGSGVSFMEDKLLWHYRSPNKEEYEMACSELGD